MEATFLQSFESEFLNNNIKKLYVSEDDTHEIELENPNIFCGIEY